MKLAHGSILIRETKCHDQGRGFDSCYRSMLREEPLKIWGGGVRAKAEKKLNSYSPREKKTQLNNPEEKKNSSVGLPEKKNSWAGWPGKKRSTQILI